MKTYHQTQQFEIHSIQIFKVQITNQTEKLNFIKLIPFIFHLISGKIHIMTSLVELRSKQINQQKLFQEFRNLSTLQKYLQRQLNVQSQIRDNYQRKIHQLETRKNCLVKLIQQSIECSSCTQLANPNFQMKKLQFPAKKMNSKTSFKEKQVNMLSKNKNSFQRSSNQLNQQRLNLKKQKQKNINYLTNKNEYKNKILIEQVKSLTKQLNLIANKSNNKQPLIIQSKVVETSSTQKNKSYFSLQLNSKFIQDLLLGLGQIQKLPKSTSSQANDLVLSSLMHNLIKQQERLVQNIEASKNLQMKKLIKQNLEQKTIQNMRLAYKQKKEQISFTQNKVIKSNRNIVKFGYTQRMLQIIKGKSAYKKKIN